ncbi:MAG TPA: methyltransferase domain-containing protein, partial [Gammaproteobacteria bacterium]|nr:methyltransferase domain-containing protein [Gammaproteobacteria bacterium]
HKELEKREFKECFDVITLWGVIEHLKYPVKTIKLCHEYLKNGGMLVIETHNPNSLTAQYQIENPDCVDRIMEGDKHILNFTIKTLRLLMEKTHFGISYWDSLGLDIVTILRYIKNATPGLINTAVYQHFDKYANEHQSTIDSLGVGDHLRIFAHKI